jgi:pimeloyl-ACP methyl ester carboxylesterase
LNGHKHNIRIINMSSETEFSMIINGMEVGEAVDGYQPVDVHTSRGVVNSRYFSVPEAVVGAVFVGGAGGGWDSPAHGLYDRLCISLPQTGIAALRVRYRRANQLTECILDVLAGLTFLETQGITKAAVIGHSFGGAVVICAGAYSPLVRTVLPLSTQTYGAQPVTELAEDCSILLIHGKADRVLPHTCSEQVYRMAHEPKAIELYEGTGHGLDEAAEAIEQRIYTWLVEQLNPEPGF